MLEPDPGLVEHLRSDPDADLPKALGTAKELAARWGLTLGPSMPGATCSLVCSARGAKGRESVLKVPVIGEEATSGCAAAFVFAGKGGVEVWEHDDASGSLLMPLPSPGTDLHASGLPDLEAVDIAADIFLELRDAQSGLDLSEPKEFMPLRRWFKELFESDPEGFGGQMGAIQELSNRLLETTTEVSLIHGDLHHFNILRHGSRWVAIDPKGVIGDPAFEVVAFMRNPIPELADWPDLVGVQERRLERFALRLGFPIERLWGWSYVETFLSAVWSGDGPWARWRDVSKALRELGVRRGWLDT